MYTPAQFKIEDVGEAHALMRARPFAVLVTQGSDGIVATHLPTVLKVDDTNALGRIECHVARPNPQWKTFARDGVALMIFQGPEAYIRPGWYPSKAEQAKRCRRGIMPPCMPTGGWRPSRTGAGCCRT